MRRLQPWLLIGSTLLIASVVAVVVFEREPRHGAAPQAPSVVATHSVLGHASEPPLAVPIFEAEPEVDAKLIPSLQMPFPAGVVVLCSQGNASEPGQTHSLPQNLHALDLSNRVLAE